MLVIRLRRVGKKNQPAFKIIVTEKKKAPTKGVFLEEVGFWNPLTKERILKIERIKYWLSVGAKPSDTLHNMLISEKVIEGEKIKKHRKSKKQEEKKEEGKKEVKTETPKETKKEEKPEVKEEVKKEKKEEVKEDVREEVKEEAKKEEVKEEVKEEKKVEEDSKE